MKRISALGILVLGAYTLAQTCPKPAPPVPPVPVELICKLPPDGGTQGCLCYATVVGGVQPNDYPVSNAKCAQAVSIAKQAAAIDNGWADGGMP